MNSNGKKYEQFVEGIKEAKTTKDKVDLIAVLLCTMATNDLHAIYKGLRLLGFGLLLVVLMLFFQDQIKLRAILGFIAKFL